MRLTIDTDESPERVAAFFEGGRFTTGGALLDASEDPEFGLRVRSVQLGPVTPEDGLVKHTTPIADFTAAVAVEEVGGTHPIDAEVAHLATIGADWYVLHGTGMHGYVISQQGHGGGNGFGPTRKQPITWWATDPALSPFAAWNTAVEFITAQVHADLKNEWEG